ncbi:MAG: permease [Candidatus Omnitrophica bacterium]|nr:permease [Candidatus Omnitrophota bacterium]MCM8803063.1 permease [Candidatus Omnitrophota bacterium]
MKKERRKEKNLKKILTSLGVIFFLIILNIWQSGSFYQLNQIIKNPKIQVFTIILLAILIEGFPFILIGSLISGSIEVLISEEKFKKIFPQGKLSSAITGSFLGFLFPVCSCGEIPVSRRLIKKGISTSGGISYLLATAIINPITLFSTYLAFSSLKMVLGRFFVAFICSVFVGILIAPKDKNEILKEYEEEHQHYENLSKIDKILLHSESDFLIMGKYLIIGATFASLFSTFTPREVFLTISNNKILSILLMEILSIILSLCSYADAFVANTFTYLPDMSKIIFMIAGPMMSISLIFVYFSAFKGKFVKKLLISVFLTLFIVGIIGSFIMR